MIELTVKKTSENPSVFTLSPSSIEIGGKDSNGVDYLHINIPEEWQGKVIRVTFSQSALYGGNIIPKILNADGVIELKNDVTLCSGDLVIDATGVDGSVSPSTGCHYTVYSHPKFGGTEQDVPLSEYQQFVSTTKEYSDSAQANATAANSSKEASAQSEQNAKSSEIAAEASANKAIEYTTVFQNSGYHNSIYRGKDISANEADGSMYTNIANGTFDDIFVGDYFTKTINGTSYVLRVAGCDSYLNRGDAALTTHHIVVVPDTVFGNYPIHDTGTIDGGYVGSKMYTDTLPLWAGYLTTSFGTHLLMLRELLVNAISSTIPSGWAWFDSKVDLMTSEEVSGCGAFGTNTSGYSFTVGINYGQLPLFRLSPDKICVRHMYWLRNIVNYSTLCALNDSGELGRNNILNSQGFRPKFLLG